MEAAACVEQVLAKSACCASSANRRVGSLGFGQRSRAHVFASDRLSSGAMSMDYRSLLLEMFGRLKRPPDDYCPLRAQLRGAERLGGKR
jgi:hypothetical protein